MVGLGPAGPDLVNIATHSAIARLAERPHARFLRTTRHPAASILPGAQSFDHVYDSEPSFTEVYARVVELLVAAAQGEGTVIYAVPGSPVVAERTVELLVADDRVEVEVVPAMSFADLAWARLGIDPVSVGVRLVDGRQFAVEAAGERGPLLVAQCDSQAVLTDVKLSVDDGTGSGSDRGREAVTVLQRLGLPDESVRTVAWDDLDREVDADHLTSLYIPVVAAPVAGEVARFAELVRTLRRSCPWDREQTHQSLTRHLLEETYEVLEAIESLPEADGGPGPWDHLEEELGDVLFQVVFHATLAAEEGRFTLADVARRVHDKLVGRHPHVFGEVEASTANQVVHNWEQIKKAEKGRSSIMDGIAGDLPSLLYAHKVQRKAASMGLDPTTDAVEAMAAFESRPSTESLGSTLMAVVAGGRRAGLDPEAALRAAAGSFRRRFLALESRARSDGVDLATLPPHELAERWDSVPD